MSDVINRLRAMGNEFTPEQIMATRELYAPLVPRPAQVGAVVARDLRYGPDDRNRLDVFHSGGAGAARPVVVFVHGGGFIQGDKGDAAAPFYNNVGAWAVREGYVGVTLTYRLAPTHQWPAGAVDLDLAISWLVANIATYGGAADKIVLMGQSAGAAHVAAYLARHGCTPGSKPAVAAAIMFSGIYELSSVDKHALHEAYYGSDLSQYAARSTAAALGALETPALYTISELDPPQFHRHLAAVYAARVAKVGRTPELLYLVGHNHVSSVMQLGCSADSASERLVEFINRHAGKA